MHRCTGHSSRVIHPWSRGWVWTCSPCAWSRYHTLICRGEVVFRSKCVEIKLYSGKFSICKTGLLKFLGFDSSWEIFLRWIRKIYLTRVSVFSRVGLYLRINFRKMGDARYYSQTRVCCNHNGPTAKRIKRLTWDSRGSEFNSCIRIFFCIYSFFAYISKLLFTCNGPSIANVPQLPNRGARRSTPTTDTHVIAHTNCWSARAATPPARGRYKTRGGERDEAVRLEQWSGSHWSGALDGRHGLTFIQTSLGETTRHWSSWSSHIECRQMDAPMVDSRWEPTPSVRCPWLRVALMASSNQVLYEEAGARFLIYLLETLWWYYSYQVFVCL